jgi:hypothetical protein
MRKLLVFLLSAAICLSLISIPALAVSADTSAKTEESAAVLNMMGALQGDGSGALNLTGTLTRSQFCKIAVVVMGLSKNVDRYASYTIFPDVPSTSWAAGYVNLAVRSAGIVSGYPNGQFGPDDIITYGQAVTVLMRILGYTATDVGSKWPDNYIQKADEIGLTDGVSLGASSSISRGDTAILFTNLLNATVNGSTKKYMENISGATVISDVFLVSTNAETDSGTSGAVQIAGSKNAVYLPVSTVPNTLVGAYGALVLNTDGKAFAFIPTDSGKTVVSTVLSVTATSIKCADGTSISMTSSPTFFFNGDSASYSDSWANISGGMLVSAYYSNGGMVQSVLVTQSASSANNVAVVTGDTYGIPSSASVYINGIAASASDIVKYDVIQYNDGYNVYNVTRKTITGLYESADPNSSNPTSITVLGTEFNVLASAVSALAGFNIGDSVTLLLTSDNKVAGVVSGTALTGTNYGVVESLSSSNATVKLTNGMTLTGKVEDLSSDVIKGKLVSVSSSKAGYLELYHIHDQSNTNTLDLANGTLGSSKLSKTVKIFDSVGDSVVSEVTLTDIIVKTVDASKIRFFATDTSGNVSLLLLNDVTGDAYTYGFIRNVSKVDSSSSLSVTYNATSVINSNGTSTSVIGSTGLYNDAVAGIADSGLGDLTGYTTLTSITGVSRSAFQQDADGTVYVTTSSGTIRVSDNVQVYMSGSGTWTTLAKARTNSNNLTIYYDRTLTTGGKVRVVIAN